MSAHEFRPSVVKVGLTLRRVATLIERLLGSMKLPSKNETPDRVDRASKQLLGKVERFDRSRIYDPWKKRWQYGLAAIPPRNGIFEIYCSHHFDAFRGLKRCLYI